LESIFQTLGTIYPPGGSTAATGASSLFEQIFAALSQAAQNGSNSVNNASNSQSSGGLSSPVSNLIQVVVVNVAGIVKSVLDVLSSISSILSILQSGLKAILSGNNPQYVVGQDLSNIGSVLAGLIGNLSGNLDPAAVPLYALLGNPLGPIAGSLFIHLTNLIATVSSLAANAALAAQNGYQAAALSKGEPGITTN